jgi:hypothetical protein
LGIGLHDFFMYNVFWSNNPGHKFEKVRGIDILFFGLFYFLISSLNIRI